MDHCTKPSKESCEPGGAEFNVQHTHTQNPDVAALACNPRSREAGVSYSSVLLTAVARYPQLGGSLPLL